jgi:hypothetical protein
MANLQPIHEKLKEFYRELRTGCYPLLELSGVIDLYDKEEEEYGAGYFGDVLRSKHAVGEPPYSYFKLFEEFAFITQDIKYILGVLTTLRPYINNPLGEAGTYLQTWEDHLYLRYSSFGYQSVYSFWDRVGDLLYLYFPTNLKSRNAYLGPVLERIPEVYKSTDAYLNLLDFYNTNIKSVLEIRHDLVHHFGFKSSQRWDHAEHHTNREKLAEKYQEKFNYRDQLEVQFLHCLEGYRLMLALIQVLPNKKPSPDELL